MTDPCQVNKTDWNESVEPNDMNKWPTEQNKSEQSYFWTFTDWTKVNWTNNFVQLTFVQSPLWLGFIVVWINYGLAQILRAFGQGAKSPTRACPGFALLARVKKIITSLTHMAWIDCGLDSLWFGSIMAWLVLQVCSVGICSMFNCPFVQFFQVQLSHVSVCSSSIDLNFNLFRFNLHQCSNDFVRLTCYLPGHTLSNRARNGRTTSQNGHFIMDSKILLKGRGIPKSMGRDAQGLGTPLGVS